jgi:hypothetical protein
MNRPARGVEDWAAAPKAETDGAAGQREELEKKRMFTNVYAISADARNIRNRSGNNLPRLAGNNLVKIAQTSRK